MSMTPEDQGAGCFRCLVVIVMIVVMIVLIVGSIVGYTMLHHKDSNSHALLKQQTVTLTG